MNRHRKPIIDSEFKGVWRVRLRSLTSKPPTFPDKFKLITFSRVDIRYPLITFQLQIYIT